MVTDIHDNTLTPSGSCNRPNGCDNNNAQYDIMNYKFYHNVDCDSDGVLDHVCLNTTNSQKWLVLSSDGCPSSWGGANRVLAECPIAFTSTSELIYFECRITINYLASLQLWNFFDVGSKKNIVKGNHFLPISSSSQGSQRGSNSALRNSFFMSHLISLRLVTTCKFTSPYQP